MTVRVRNKQSGMPLQTQFADTFNRASGFPGSDWIVGISAILPFVQPIQVEQYSIGASTLAPFGQCLRVTPLQSAANPNTDCPGWMIADRVYQNDLNGTSKFTEAVIIQNTGVGVERMNAGISIQHKADENTCYFLECIPSINVMQIGKNVQGTITFPFGALADPTVANNDKVSIAVVVSAGQVDFTVRKNDVIVGTKTDATGSRIVTGGMGFWTRGAGGAIPGIAEWRNFRCGLGTP